MEYVIVGASAEILWPEPGVSERTDGLWNTTCLEAFFSQTDGSYVEYNFAPSRAWASYRFEGYRDGMAPALDLHAPEMFIERDEQRLGLTVFVDFPAGKIGSMQSVALSAVIEEKDGRKSYWALAHPPGKPDFHHPSCFALTLPAPSTA